PGQAARAAATSASTSLVGPRHNSAPVAGSWETSSSLKTALLDDRSGGGTGGHLRLVGPSARSYRRKRNAATAARRRDGSLAPRARLGDRSAATRGKGRSISVSKDIGGDA